MKNVSTGKIIPVEPPRGRRSETDWARVRAMTDAYVRHDEDSPATTRADWEGALLKQDGVVVGRARAREP